MIRMRAAAIRILIIAAMLAIALLCAGTTVQYGTIVTLQKITGARVDIASTNVGIWPPRVTYRDVRVADPSKEREDAVRIELADLQIDGQALLHRKYQIASATLAGVEFSVARNESGQLDHDEQVEQEGGGVDLSPHLKRLNRWVEATAKLEADQAIDSLETVQTARTLEDEWKLRLDNVAARAHRLEATIKELKTSVRDINNPLRDLKRLQQTLQAADRVRHDLILIRGEAEALPMQLTNDLETLEAARQRDQQKVADLGRNLLGADTVSDLAPELLRATLQRRLASLQQYIELAQQTAELTVLSPEASRQRGEIYDLDGRRSDDAWLIRHCKLNGILRKGGNSFDVTGIVENLASGGRSQTEDGRLRFRIEGGSIARVDYDRPSVRSGRADTFSLHIPRVDVPEQAIGEAEKFQLAIGPSQLELWVRTSLAGSALTGEIYARQRVSTVDVALDDRRPLCRNIEASLDESLGQIQLVETRATISGSVRRPTIAGLQTNLGGALQTAFVAATETAAQTSRQALQAKVDEAYAKERQKLDQALALHHAKLMGEINQIDARIGEAQKELMAGLQVPGSYLERIGRATGGLRR